MFACPKIGFHESHTRVSSRNLGHTDLLLFDSYLIRTFVWGCRTFARDNHHNPFWESLILISGSACWSCMPDLFVWKSETHGNPKSTSNIFFQAMGTPRKFWSFTSPSVRVWPTKQPPPWERVCRSWRCFRSRNLGHRHGFFSTLGTPDLGTPLCIQYTHMDWLPLAML